MIQTNKEREANGLSHNFKNLVTALPIHRWNDILYYMTEKYFRQCNRCKTKQKMDRSFEVQKVIKDNRGTNTQH